MLALSPKLKILKGLFILRSWNLSRRSQPYLLVNLVPSWQLLLWSSRCLARVQLAHHTKPSSIPCLSSRRLRATLSLSILSHCVVHWFCFYEHPESFLVFISQWDLDSSFGCSTGLTFGVFSFCLFAFSNLYSEITAVVLSLNSCPHWEAQLGLWDGANPIMPTQVMGAPPGLARRCSSLENRKLSLSNGSHSPVVVTVGIQTHYATQLPPLLSMKFY